MRDKGTGVDIVDPLPRNNDPYSEIYLSPEWYGLVPDANLGLMNPSGQMHAQSFDDVEESPEQPREKLNMIINKIRKFHESIRQQYKAPTYAHYGAQGIRNSNGDAGGFSGQGSLQTRIETLGVR